MSPLPSGIILTADHWAQMEADVDARVPEEACGFVVGKNNQSISVIPVTNSLHDPFRFKMDPDEELKIFLLVEKNGWDILAVYHSHPHGIDQPSQTDFDQLTFPGVVYLIWYQVNKMWRCRGYLMKNQLESEEIQVVISTNTGQ
jgi:proteasome lid subunit RPN8/RPN11